MGKSLKFVRALHPLLQNKIKSIIDSCSNPEELNTASEWVDRLKLSEDNRQRLQNYCALKNLEFHDQQYNEGRQHGLTT